MQNSHLSQFVPKATIAVPMYPLHGLNRPSAIAATFAPTRRMMCCSQLYMQGWQYLESGYCEAALNTFRALLSRGQRASHKGWIGTATPAIAEIPVEAVADDSEAVKDAVNASDFQTAQQCNSAIVLHAQGYQQQARQIYQQTLEDATKADHPLAMAVCLNGLGLLYLENEQYALAEARLRAAVEVLTDLHIPTQSAIAAHNLGITHYQRGYYQAAQIWFQRALGQWQLCEDSLGLALTLDYLGRVYVQQGQSWLALGSFEAATDVLNELADQQDVRQEVAALFTQIADLCDKTQHKDVAIAYWQEVLKLYQTMPATTLHVIIWHRLSRLYDQTGHRAIARHYAQLIIQASQT